MGRHDVITVPHETVEYIPVPVTLNGVVTTTGVEFAVVADGIRPTTWTAAVVLSSATYVLLTGLTAGQWRVWARVTAAPEIAVIECGYITVT
jgi:hypothetical protein